jgi:hypothetical protein
MRIEDVFSLCQRIKDMKRMWYWVGLAVLTPMVVGIVIAQDPTPEVKEVEIRAIQTQGFPGAPVTAEWSQAVPHPGMPHNVFGFTRGLTINFTKDGELHKAIEEYKSADGEKSKATKLETITKLVSEQFEARQKARDTELKQLEANLKKLRDTHAKRESEKDVIIRDRVRQITRDSDGLGWGEDAPHADVLFAPSADVRIHRAPLTAPVPLLPSTPEAR